MASLTKNLFLHSMHLTPFPPQPVYVFDGKPPELKLATLAGRREKKDEAVDALQQAKVPLTHSLTLTDTLTRMRELTHTHTRARAHEKSKVSLIRSLSHTNTHSRARMREPTRTNPRQMHE